MARHKYKFTNKKHSVGGMISTFMALVAIILFVADIVMSFKARGEGGTVIGTVALSALAFAIFGLAIGLLSYKEVDKYYRFSFVGSLTNGIVTVVFIMLLFVGL